MKTNIILNIGLESSNGTPVELHHAIHEIERAGITCLASGVVRGQWEGREENTLVISGLAMESPELRPRLYSASRALSQHCIALWMNGAGGLIGDNPAGYAFNADLFHFHPRESAPELSPCQSIQAAAQAMGDTLASGDAERLAMIAKHDSKARSIEAEGFIGWLESTLIPDLKESGSEATAEDFETLIAHYRAK